MDLARAVHPPDEGELDVGRAARPRDEIHAARPPRPRRIERLRDIPLAPPGGIPTHAELLDLRAPVRTFELVPVENRTGEWRSIEQGGVWIDRVRVGDEEFRAGTVSIAFGADGGADPAELILADEGEHKLRIVIVAFTGEVRVEEIPNDG